MYDWTDNFLRAFTGKVQNYNCACDNSTSKIQNKKLDYNILYRCTMSKQIMCWTQFVLTSIICKNSSMIITVTAFNISIVLHVRENNMNCRACFSFSVGDGTVHIHITKTWFRSIIIKIKNTYFGIIIYSIIFNWVFLLSRYYKRKTYK